MFHCRPELFQVFSSLRAEFSNKSLTSQSANINSVFYGSKLNPVKCNHECPRQLRPTLIVEQMTWQAAWWTQWTGSLSPDDEVDVSPGSRTCCYRKATVVSLSCNFCWEALFDRTKAAVPSVLLHLPENQRLLISYEKQTYMSSRLEPFCQKQHFCTIFPFSNFCSGRIWY